MPTHVFGLPVHPLIIHATVVAIPTAAVAVLLAALWPKFRRWVDWGPPALAIVSLILVPMTTSSGENLEHELPHSALIERHAELADNMIWWTIGLAVVGIALWLWHRSGTRVLAGHDVPMWVGLTARVLSVPVALGTIVWVVLVGHAGAEAAWSGT